MFSGRKAFRKQPSLFHPARLIMYGPSCILRSVRFSTAPSNSLQPLNNCQEQFSGAPPQLSRAPHELLTSSSAAPQQLLSSFQQLLSSFQKFSKAPQQIFRSSQKLVRSFQKLRSSSQELLSSSQQLLDNCHEQFSGFQELLRNSQALSGAFSSSSVIFRSPSAAVSRSSMLARGSFQELHSIHQKLSGILPQPPRHLQQLAAAPSSSQEPFGCSSAALQHFPAALQQLSGIPSSSSAAISNSQESQELLSSLQ